MSNLAERIIIIDPDEQDGARLRDYLSAKGYDIRWVKTSAQAASIVSDFPPDLIFADVTNSQIASVPRIKNQDYETQLVVVSEVHQAGDVVACLRAGAADFILKPVDDYASIDNVISRRVEKIRLTKSNILLQQELEERNEKLREGIQELRTDQKAGLQVQLKMLPQPSRDINGFHFEHLIRPSLYLSGDFLDYFNLDEKRVLFYFADVSGHGASSSFVTVLLKNLTMRLKRNLKRGSSDEISSTDRFLKRMNQELLASDLGKHVTVFAGILNKENNELLYSVGGHFPMPVIESEGKVEFLEGKGMAVGLFPEPQYEVYRKQVSNDFRITVFSDGILEVVPGQSLNDKEKLLLDVVSRETDGIESLLSSLGVNDLAELPDDIAVLTVSKNSQ